MKSQTGTIPLMVQRANGHRVSFRHCRHYENELLRGFLPS